jgi:LmbE family N-acetylglucosaminyl deacetylase
MQSIPASAAQSGIRRASLRRAAQQVLLTLHRRRVKPLPGFDRPAVVFAPHQDDETLGCGGTILCKRQAGVPVRIIFFTDGSTSHAAHLPIEELSALRRAEAISAAAALGVNESDVIFLNYPDGQLHAHSSAAAEDACALIQNDRQLDLFIPSRLDAPSDHIHVWQAGLAAFHRFKSAMDLRVYEYPVWFWNHWPWVSFLQENRRQTKDVLVQTAKTFAGLRLLTRFGYGVDIRTVLDEKRAALEQHRSQMVRLKPTSSWMTLADVAKGDFLPRFFQNDEIFALVASTQSTQS